MTERKPAVVYPPGTFVLEEMAERGWDFDRLCAECGREGEVWWIGRLRRYICGDAADWEVGSVSRGLARGFGASAEMWVNLDRAWQEHLRDATKMIGG